MVDALHEAHRVLAPRGLLVDARPDSRVLAHAEQVLPERYRRLGTIRTSREELENDRASDRAVSRVVREGLFAHGRSGRFWHHVRFADLAALEQYLREHLRFEHRVRWSVGAAVRRRLAKEPFAIRRAVRYELLRRRTPRVSARA